MDHIHVIKDTTATVEKKPLLQVLPTLVQYPYTAQKF